MYRAVEPDDSVPVVVERGPGAAGGELVLRQAGAHFEIISNGVFLMDTRDGASEREMVRASLQVLSGDARTPTGIRILIGGLGVGFSACAALDDDRVAQVRIVELEPQVIEWHRGPLAPVAGHLLDDPRTDVTCADFVTWLAGADEVFDAVCLDIDNGPAWTVAEGNGRLYEPEALARLEGIISPGGVAAFWSAMPAPDFASLLERRYGAVEAIEVPARRGDPDIVYAARVRG